MYVPRLRRARLADEGLAEETARAAALAAPAMTLDVVANLLNGIEEVFQAAAGPEAQQKYLDDVLARFIANGKPMPRTREPAQQCTCSCQCRTKEGLGVCLRLT